jgi:hypothetical protein
VNFLQVESRQTIDNTIFTFGLYESEEKTQFGYKVFCAGAGSHHLEWFFPLKGAALNEFISNLKNLHNVNFKKKVKIKRAWSNVNLNFLGFDPQKGIKIKSNISGFLSYSGAFGSSYISQSELERLIKNLERCV